MIRYLVHNLAVDGTRKVLPFSITLPHDCKKVLGFTASTDAMVQTVVDDLIANTLFGLAEGALKEMVIGMRRTGNIPAQLQYTSIYAGTTVVWPTINLTKNKVGSVTVRTQKEVIAVEMLTPMRFRLIFRNIDVSPFPRIEEQFLALPLISSIEDRLQPVDVSNELEIAGWLELTEAGLRIGPAGKSAADFILDEDELLPYNVSITLAYDNGK